MGFLSRLGRFIVIYWRSLVICLAPLVYLPIFVGNDTPAYRMLYVVVLMATYWVTESLPLGVTALIPVFLYPILSILETDRTCMMYMRETVLMFAGSIMIASAIEFCNLHVRIALRAIMWIGCTHRRLSFGLMAITTFMSMWITNTAAVAMMCPISYAVISELEGQGLCHLYEPKRIKKPKPTEDDGENDAVVVVDDDDDDELPRPSKITLCYFLAAAYASTIGGVGTIVGTGTNLTLKGIYEGIFPDSPGIDFPSFMFYNVPGMLISAFVSWIYLQYLYMGMFRPNSEDAKNATLDKGGQAIVMAVIKKKYDDLGPITVHELSVGILFMFAIFLWFFRQPGFIDGWASIFTDLKVRDATPSMFIVILLFMFPVNYGFLKFFRCGEGADDDLPKKPSPALITWKFLQDKFPWGLLFLLGGGFALAEGGRVSGMSAMIGNALKGLDKFSPFVILFFVCLACQILTEFTSNVAIANIILPVLAEMSRAIKMHPLYLMLPAGVTCSFAFHMPVGTPPNAIVAGAVNIRTKDMMIAGIGPSLITLLTVWLSFPTYGALIYPDLNEFPDWAVEKTGNSTA